MPVSTCEIGALCRLCIPECLLDVGDDCSTALTDESSKVQLWSNFGRAGDGSRDRKEFANLRGSKLANSRDQGKVVEGECEELVRLLICCSRVLSVALTANTVACNG